MISVVTLEPRSESSVRTLDERCVGLDIFAPPRDEYRRSGAGLGVTL